MATITVEDILSDLATIQQANSSSRSAALQSSSSSDPNVALNPTRHPLLDLGHSLLPEKLRSNDQANAKSFEFLSSNKASSDKSQISSDDLDAALSALEGTKAGSEQAAALYLARLYLHHTSGVLALNEDGTERAAEEHSAGKFDDLHRKVASLQAANETVLTRVQEIRNLVISEDNTAPL